MLIFKWLKGAKGKYSGLTSDRCSCLWLGGGQQFCAWPAGMALFFQDSFSIKHFSLYSRNCCEEIIFGCKIRWFSPQNVTGWDKSDPWAPDPMVSAAHLSNHHPWPPLRSPWCFGCCPCPAAPHWPFLSPSSYRNQPPIRSLLGSSLNLSCSLIYLLLESEDNSEYQLSVRTWGGVDGNHQISFFWIFCSCTATNWNIWFYFPPHLHSLSLIIFCTAD